MTQDTKREGDLPVSHRTTTLTRNTLRDNVFQIKLSIAQAKSPEEREKLEALLSVYQAELDKQNKRRYIGLAVLVVIVVICLIIAYLFLLFKSDSQKSKSVWNPSSSKTISTSTTTSSTSSSIPSSSNTKAGIPLSFVGTWSGTVGSSNITLTITDDGTITKTQDNHTVTEQISSYEEVGSNLYHLNSTTGSQALSTLIFSGIGGTNVKYATGIYIKDDLLYPQLWSANTNSDFVYSASTRIALKRGLSISYSIDTTHITKKKIQRWVLSEKKKKKQLSETEKANYFVNVKSYSDNLVYASVRANSAPDEKRALYRINASGQLEQGKIDATEWKVVSSTYSE